MLRSFRGGTDDGGSGTGSAHAEPVETRLGSGSGSMRATDVLSRPPVGSREKGTNAARKGTVSVASRSVFHAPRVRGVEARPPVPAVRVPGPARRPKAHLPERIRHRAHDAAPRPTAGHARHLERLRQTTTHDVLRARRVAGDFSSGGVFSYGPLVCDSGWEWSTLIFSFLHSRYMIKSVVKTASHLRRAGAFLFFEPGFGKLRRGNIQICAAADRAPHVGATTHGARDPGFGAAAGRTGGDPSLLGAETRLASGVTRRRVCVLRKCARIFVFYIGTRQTDRAFDRRRRLNANGFTESE